MGSVPLRASRKTSSSRYWRDLTIPGGWYKIDILVADYFDKGIFNTLVVNGSLDPTI